jgi:hypothetical protein
MQMVVWQIAQWKLMEQYCEQREARSKGQADNANTAKAVPPPFLAGVIVYGDRWVLVATAPPEKKEGKYVSCGLTFWSLALQNTRLGLTIC